MKVWTCALQLEPTAKAAVKVSMQGGFVRKYTPAKTRDAMNDIRYALQKAGAPLFEGAIAVVIHFHRKRPKSAKKNAQPITRPDLSNYIKLLEDAANGVLWHDDAQIVSLLTKKVYSESPSIYIEVSEVI